jgi:hypothetical protein
LGSLSQAEFEELADWYSPPVYNARGLRVGEVVPDVDLEEAGQESETAGDGVHWRPVVEKTS